jgi:hypothetical protein
MPVPQCPGGHVARFSLARYWPGCPSRWPLLLRSLEPSAHADVCQRLRSPKRQLKPEHTY